MMVFDGLNPEQQRAVTAGEGPVLIVAGPGTGKTKTLTARIVYLMTERAVQPEHILALTFTKKAAEEMKDRVAANVGSAPMPTICTFHALCHEILGDEREFVADAQRLQIVRSLPRPKALKSLSARELGLAISRAKNVPDIEDASLAKAVAAYNQALTDQALRDFDDLLLDAYHLLRDNESARRDVQARYRHVLVDEFQDTNNLQYELLKLICGHDNLFVIGDPNQSIYGFRGASNTIFEAFKADYPNYSEITLVMNYRSKQRIVGLSNALFAGVDLQAQNQESGHARAVQVLNEYGEAAWIINQIQRSIGGSDLLKTSSDDGLTQHRRLSDFAVLYRSRSAALTFQKILAESGLPYQIVGDGSPYDQPNIQAIIALLRTAVRREPIELEGYGSAQRRLLEQELSRALEAKPSVLVEKIRSILGLELNAAMQQFAGVLVRFKDVPSALAYFDAIAEDGFYDATVDAITLLTIHASKGLEFPFVFLLGAEEDILPSRRGDPSEERRLFYVAVTRARERLEITHARNRGGQKTEASHFVAELPATVLDRHIDPDIEAQLRRIAKRAAKNSQTSLF